MSIAKMFDRVVVINAITQPDRLARVERRLGSLGIAFERFPAIITHVGGGFSSPGHRGCFLSHFAIVEQALKDGLENVLILEDDVILREDSIPLLYAAWVELPAAWKIFYLGSCLADSGLCYSISEHIYSVKYSYHTHAYALSRSGMADFVNALCPWKEQAQAPYFDQWLAHNDWMKFHIHPIVAVQEPSFSLIENKVTNRMSEYFGKIWSQDEFLAHCPELETMLRELKQQ